MIRTAERLVLVQGEKVAMLGDPTASLAAEEVAR